MTRERGYLQAQVPALFPQIPCDRVFPDPVLRTEQSIPSQLPKIPCVGRTSFI